MESLVYDLTNALNSNNANHLNASSHLYTRKRSGGTTTIPADSSQVKRKAQSGNRIQKRKQYTKSIFTKRPIQSSKSGAKTRVSQRNAGSVPSRSLISLLSQNGGVKNPAPVETSSSNNRPHRAHRRHKSSTCRRHNSLTSLRSASSVRHQKTHPTLSANLLTGSSGTRNENSNLKGANNSNPPNGSNRSNNAASLAKKHNKIMKVLLAARASISKFQVGDSGVCGEATVKTAAAIRQASRAEKHSSSSSKATETNTSSTAFNLDDLVRIKRSSLYKLKSNNHGHNRICDHLNNANSGLDHDELFGNGSFKNLKNSDLHKNKKKVCLV
jgi:hypothetical protein